jgi:hypothetical protein
MDLRHFGHKNGLEYFLRFGHSGAGDWPGPGGDVMNGVGRGVSNSRYRYSTSWSRVSFSGSLSMVVL